MKDILFAGRALLLDMAATLAFLALYLLTHSILLAVSLGLVLALAQIGWRLGRGNKVDALQWMSLFLIASSGAATLVTHNPVFVMAKPSAIYLLCGLTMLQRGWMIRYMPPIALQLMPDIVVISGYVWAGLMFFSAALNLMLAWNTDLVTWGVIMSVWGIASKLGLFSIQYATMRLIGRRRYHADVTDNFPPEAELTT